MYIQYPFGTTVNFFTGKFLPLASGTSFRRFFSDTLFAMNQTLLIEHESELKTILSEKLRGLGLEVIHQTSAEDAVGLLGILPDLKLVIARAPEAFEICEFIRQEALPIALIVLGNCPELEGEVYFLPLPLDISGFIGIVREHFQILETEMQAFELVKSLESEELTSDERVSLQAQAQELAKEMIRKEGLISGAVQLSSTAIFQIASMVLESSQVASDIRLVSRGNVSVEYQRCHLQIVICHYILRKQNWYERKHLETMSFVSFFGDLNQEVEAHPLANFYAKTVAEEWRLKNFASEEFHVLSKIFIIADEFVRIVLDPNLSSKKKEILPAISIKYPEASYQKIIRCLEQSY